MNQSVLSLAQLSPHLFYPFPSFMSLYNTLPSLFSTLKVIEKLPEALLLYVQVSRIEYWETYGGDLDQMCILFKCRPVFLDLSANNIIFLYTNISSVSNLRENFLKIGRGYCPEWFPDNNYVLDKTLALLGPH